MQVHKPTYCCPTMEGWVATNKITINYVAGTAHTNVVHTETPADDEDQEPIITRIEVKCCPNCGELIKPYSAPVPLPTYTRATATGDLCEDVTCRHLNTITGRCSFAFRNIGCFSTDPAVRDAYADLKASFNTGWQQFNTE